MYLVNKIKIFLLFLGDVLALYLALFIVLALRYGGNFYSQLVDRHFLPFTIVFALWITTFYIAGLYDLRRLRNNIEFLKTLSLTVFINALLTILFFYALTPVFGITPKTNLFIFVGAFAVIEVLWRRWFNNMASSGEAPNKILLIGNTGSAEEIVKTVCDNPQLGYEIKVWLKNEPTESPPQALHELVRNNKINLIVIPRHLKRDGKMASALYKLLNYGVTVYDLTNFYELVMGKVPIADLEEAWFLENSVEQQKFYDPLKRAWEFLAALILGIILLPLEILIALLIRLTSRGPATYKQMRVGQGGREFTLYKFRTMKVDAEKDGAKWADPADKRSTGFGRFLRHTHLDELPQLFNVIKGELSFVGPRPERPEFVKVLKEKVPYYEIRLLVKPGVTGWAQINFHKDTTTEDVAQKLQYDIYYLKNRSIILDMAIILRTLKSFFINPK